MALPHDQRQSRRRSADETLVRQLTRIAEALEPILIGIYLCAALLGGLLALRVYELFVR